VRRDARNTLTAVYENGVEQGRYDYDRNLIRVRRTTASENVEYVLDDKHVLNELDGSQAGKPSIRRYHYGTKVLAVTESAGTSYILNDGIGSASDFWSSTGTLAKSRQYDAWGGFRNGTAPAAGEAKVAYTGHQYDPETGWVYAKARYYDSGLGVFLSRDSYEGEIEEAPSLHRFMYARDNPLSYWDPEGYLDAATATLPTVVLPVVPIPAVVLGFIVYLTASQANPDAGDLFCAGDPACVSIQASSRLDYEDMKEKGRQAAMKQDAAKKDQSTGGDPGNQPPGKKEPDKKPESAKDTKDIKEKANPEKPPSENGGGGGGGEGAAGPTKVWRVIRPDEDPGKGLQAKNPAANYKPEGHVLHGSKQDFKSQYISTTTKPEVAAEQAKKSGNRVVEIDLTKVDSKKVDLSTDAGRKEHLKGVTATNWAKKSGEVLVEKSVPPEAVREVPVGSLPTGNAATGSPEQTR
jgi:RHS repeat-associated protein